MVMGTNPLIISANPTEITRNTVPVRLITAAERNGIFIPALPIPIEAAKLSTDTAMISSIILSILSPRLYIMI